MSDANGYLGFWCLYMILFISVVFHPTNISTTKILYKMSSFKQYYVYFMRIISHLFQLINQ